MHCVLNLSVAQVKSIIRDIALTINIHPANLCIEAEEDGKVYVGQDVVLKVWVAKNPFEMEKKIRSKLGSSNFRSFSGNLKQVCGRPRRLLGDTYIPSRILQIHVSFTASPWAIIVMEHRNLGTSLKWFEDNTRGCLIVMVCIHFCLFIAVSYSIPPRLRGIPRSLLGNSYISSPKKYHPKPNSSTTPITTCTVRTSSPSSSMDVKPRLGPRTSWCALDLCGQVLEGRISLTSTAVITKDLPAGKRGKHNSNADFNGSSLGLIRAFSPGCGSLIYSEESLYLGKRSRVWRLGLV